MLHQLAQIQKLKCVEGNAVVNKSQGTDCSNLKVRGSLSGK